LNRVRAWSRLVSMRTKTRVIQSGAASSAYKDAGRAGQRARKSSYTGHSKTKCSTSSTLSLVPVRPDLPAGGQEWRQVQSRGGSGAPHAAPDDPGRPQGAHSHCATESSCSGLNMSHGFLCGADEQGHRPAHEVHLCRAKRENLGHVRAQSNPP
jgi:hypothetical protein